MESARKDIASAAALFNRFLRPYWRKVALVVAFNVVIGFLMSLRPLVIAPALDVFAKTRSEPAAGFGDLSLNNLGPTLLDISGLEADNIMAVGFFVAVLYFLLALVVASLNMAAHVLLTRIKTAMQYDMIVTLHRNLLSLSFGFLQRKRGGDLVSRLTGDVVATANSMDSVARGMLQSLAQTCVTVMILFRTDALFTVFLLLIGSVHFLITARLGRSVIKKSVDVTDTRGTLASSLTESFAGIRVIKSFAAERYDAAKTAGAAETFRKSTERLRILLYMQTPVRMVADAFLVGVVIMLAFHSIVEGRLTLQAAALIFFLSQQLLTPVSQFFNEVINAQNMLGGARRVMELLEAKSSIKDGDKQAGKLEKEIVLENVRFGYEEKTPVLRGINLIIKRGEMTAIVGPSGAGKSTLVDIVLRLYDVDEGRVTYDGVDIREFTQKSYRRNFGVVAQESLLFNDTVRENIVFNRKENEDDLRHALWVANAEGFVAKLPGGLDTVVGDRGVRLSGGQRQRIAIARAVYGRPSILALDEATSSLDSESEREVQKAIDRMTREMTMIVIAHRLSTVMHADKIVVVNDGGVEAVGPHDELMSQSPTYGRLYNYQFLESGEDAERLRPYGDVRGVQK
ncbi:MAG: ABC transporter ATP-binding protein [Candidatus Nitrospinota bacterium M3_3B_026]